MSIRRHNNHTYACENDRSRNNIAERQLNNSLKFEKEFIDKMLQECYVHGNVLSIYYSSLPTYLRKLTFMTLTFAERQIYFNDFVNTYCNYVFIDKRFETVVDRIKGICKNDFYIYSGYIKIFLSQLDRDELFEFLTEVITSDIELIADLNTEYVFNYVNDIVCEFVYTNNLMLDIITKYNSILTENMIINIILETIELGKTSLANFIKLVRSFSNVNIYEEE